LAAAIRKLRVDGDATAALSLLDQRGARLTDSALSPEASAVRIEALLKLGRVDAALSDLERLPLDAVPRRDEWHVVRGELRAQAGRWSSAEADFTAVLSGRLRGADGDLAERALWGRAAARSHQGNLAGARTDSSEYLRRFPSGRFANQASQALLGASPR
jgi:tetratricopeptide (TPR) repeat protein